MSEYTVQYTDLFSSLPPPWHFGSLPAYHTSPFSATRSGKNEPSPLPGYDIRCHSLARSLLSLFSSSFMGLFLFFGVAPCYHTCYLPTKKPGEVITLPGYLSLFLSLRCLLRC